MFEKEIISLLQTHFCVFVLIFFLFIICDLWWIFECF